MSSKTETLIKEGPRVVNIGLDSFADNLASLGAPVTRLDWRPPGEGDAELARLVAELADDTEGAGALIREANGVALSRFLAARPMWVGMARAIDVIPGMDDHTILHAGPPVDWDGMCGPIKGAVVGALLYEGWARSEKQAWRLAASGRIRYSPCNDHQAVGPMAGIISPSMPVMVVRNETAGNIAYATMNEGWGRALRFGAYDPPVIRKLKWMEKTLAPALKGAVEQMGGIDVRSMTARALHMGDECHNRDVAATTLLFRDLTLALAGTVRSRSVLASVLDFLAHQEHFFLNVSMAACKAALQAAEGVPNSTMVTVLARNGRELGLRVSALPDRWFAAITGTAEGLFFPGYSAADANPDIGDSAISEAAGIGAFVMATAPAITQVIGGTTETALAATQNMYRITLGENPNYTLPILGFRGGPAGIDVRRVVETGITPLIDTGIAHKDPGHGSIGAGIAKAPLACFNEALRAMADHVRKAVDKGAGL